MALMLGKLNDALLAGGVPADKAQAATRTALGTNKLGPALHALT